MSTTCHAYYSIITVRDRLRAFLCVSKPQLTNLSLLVFGLFTASNCQLPRIAVQLPRIAAQLPRIAVQLPRIAAQLPRIAAQLPRIAAQLPLLTGAASLTQRLRRLLMNKAIAPTTLYEPVARFLLAAFTGGCVRLILDATDLGGRLPVLFVAVAYRGRALPLAWRMLPHMGCSPFREQKALLSRVVALLPPGVTVTFLADREYGTQAVIRWCFQHGWHFCLRLKKSRGLLLADGTSVLIGSLPLARGGRLFRAGVRLPALPDQPLSLSCGWSTDNKDDEPWYILSDLPVDEHTFHRVLSIYNVRFHIEEMFRDFKEFGFRLETTHLRDPERVSRLLLCVCLAHVWMMNAGVWVSKRGLRRQVDRHKRRQLSYFQIGWRFLQKMLACDQPLRCQLEVYA